jgi:hypothetical protein
LCTLTGKTADADDGTFWGAVTKFFADKEPEWGRDLKIGAAAM